MFSRLASSRRVEGRGEDSFYKHHEAEVTASDIAKYIPSWSSLNWQEIKDSFFGKSESYAKDGEFKVNVMVSENSKMSHAEARTAFAKFMVGNTYER